MTVTPVGFSEPDAAVMSGGAPTCTGFYKTTFSIDDTREIFLTGLTESTLEQVQTELTASALADRYFSLTNVDFIDAGKGIHRCCGRGDCLGRQPLLGCRFVQYAPVQRLGERSGLPDRGRSV